MDFKMCLGIFLVFFLVSYVLALPDPHRINGAEEVVGGYEGYEAYDPAGYLREKQVETNWLSPPDPNFQRVMV
ncbi:hypothetical protein M8J77_013602 [Diaphorina citri]|nr:hypothetical protein M8J77_013602 [Diaphorina citri]